MKKISQLVLVIILVSFVLPNVLFAVTPRFQRDGTPSYPTDAPVTTSGPSLWQRFKDAPIWDWSLSSLWGGGDSSKQPAQAAPTAPSSVPNITYQGGTGIGGLFIWLGRILGLIFPLIVSIAVLWFIARVFQYTIMEGEEERAKAKTQLIWGIVGIFVMVSVWGLVNILQSTFRLTNTTIMAPGIQTSIE